MFSFKGPAKAGSLCALGLAATALVPAAQAAEVTFIGVTNDNPTEEDQAWGTPDNWSPVGVPGEFDDVVIGPDPIFIGPVVTDPRKVKSLLLNAGINIHRDGSLTVTEGITNNATPGYFINDGIVTGALTNNAYIANSYEYHGDVTNNAEGGIVNDGVEDGDVTVGKWYGNILHNEGLIINSTGIWNGDVVENDGLIFNEKEGATWNGDVLSNDGFISSNGLWNGDINNTNGALWMTGGVVNGSINNDGGLGMDDDSAEGVLSVKSWSGNGTALFDLSLGLRRADQVALSGDYTADTEISFNIVGPPQRFLGDITLITVGGANTGTVTTFGLPEDGVIRYRIERSGNDWVLAAGLNQAPEHVAAAMEFMGRTLASAERVPLSRADACGTGGWAHALGSTYDSTISDVDSTVSFGGGQVGYDVFCVAVGPEAALGLGVTGGGTLGKIDQDFDGDGGVDGDFLQGFAGLYADFAAGPLRAILQGQVGFSSTNLSDPQSSLDEATLDTTRYDLSGRASYELAVGGMSIAPEVGFAASMGESRSDDFADVGEMSLETDPLLDAYLGATFSGNVLLPDGATTFAPSIRVALHDDLLSPSTATFTDSAGGTADVPVEGLGTYVALGVGAEFFHAPATSGTSMDIGVHGDFKISDRVAESSLSGYARMKF